MVMSAKELYKKYRGESLPKYHVVDWVFDKYSIYITRLLLYTSITANQASILSFFFGLLGALFFFLGDLKYIMIGCFLIIISYIFDYADGVIARYRNQTGLLGIHVDQISHLTIPRFMFFGLAFGVFIKTGWVPILIFGFLSSFFACSIVYTALSTSLPVIKDRVKNISTHLDIKKENRKIEKKDKRSMAYLTLIKRTKQIKLLWTFPTYLVEIMIIVLIEIANKYFNLFPPYLLLTAFIVLFGIIFTVIQTISFYVNIKSKSINSFYIWLYDRKK